MEVFGMSVDSVRMIKDKNYCREVFNHFIQNKIIHKVEPDLFIKHMNKAVDNLEFGNFIFNEHLYSIKKKFRDKFFYDWCIVIYYYSVYHALLALIFKAGFKSKNHLASISALTYIYYHKRNLLNKEDIQFILDGFMIEAEDIEFMINSKEMRERASYSVDVSFNLYLAKEMQEKTANFVTKVKLMLQGEIGARDRNIKEKSLKNKVKRKVMNVQKKGENGARK